MCVLRELIVTVNPLFVNAQQKLPKPDEIDGMRELVEAIGQAYGRAEAEGGNKAILVYMNHDTNGKSMRPLVKHLVANDGEFKPGKWYEDSKYPKDSSNKPFKTVVEKVERGSDVKWLSWLPVKGGADAVTRVN